MIVIHNLNFYIHQAMFSFMVLLNNTNRRDQKIKPELIQRRKKIQIYGEAIIFSLLVGILLDLAMEINGSFGRKHLCFPCYQMLLKTEITCPTSSDNLKNLFSNTACIYRYSIQESITWGVNDATWFPIKIKITFLRKPNQFVIDTNVCHKQSIHYFGLF